MANNQHLVDKNLTELFELPKATEHRSITELSKNIIRSTSDKESVGPITNVLTENESNFSNEKPKRKYTKRASTRGGARMGAGRPKGSSNKINSDDLIFDFQAQAGMSFEQFVNSRILLASADNNHELVSRYILGMAKYFISDVKEVDITSNGQTIGANFSFPQVELPDWQDDTPTTH